MDAAVLSRETLLDIEPRVGASGRAYESSDRIESAAQKSSPSEIGRSFLDVGDRDGPRNHDVGACSRAARPATPGVQGFNAARSAGLWARR